MGRRGCGKSFLAKRIQGLWKRRLIIDSLNEYTEGEMVHSFAQLGALLTQKKATNSQEFTIVFQFDPESPASVAEFDHILRLAYYYGNIQVVVEEIQLYCTTHMMPHWLKTSLLTGRHQNMAMLFTSQRPGEVHKTIISQCSHVFCGNIQEGNDIRYLSNFFREESEKLARLPDRRFLYLSKTGIQEIGNDF
jgi:hypothetical protein